MKAIAWTAPGVVRLIEVAEPRPGVGEALLRPAFTGVCGTDLAVIAGEHARATAPVILGHEFSAAVEWAPPGSGFIAGDPVAVEPVVSCGTCEECASGYDNLCAAMGLLGIDHDGSLAELCVAPTRRLRRLPSTDALLTGALVEPTAVAIRALRHARLADRGARLFVSGSGPIGLLIALVARSRGADVVLSDLSSERRALAESFGFATVDPANEPLPMRVDAAVEAAGSPHSFTSCLAVVRPGGVVVQLGLPHTPAELSLARIIATEVHIVGSRIYTPADYDEALRLLMAGEIETESLVTRHISFEDIAAEGFAAVGTDPRSIKTVITGLAHSGSSSR